MTDLHRWPSNNEPTAAQPAPEAAAGGWDLTKIVGALRGRGGRGGPRRADLISREALAGVIAGLRGALFPVHFGPPDLTDDGVEYFVGHTLDVTLLALQEQARRGLRADAERVGGDPEAAGRKAAELTRAFAEQLPGIQALLESDVQAAYRGDPAAHSLEEPLFCYPGITAATHHRVAHALYRLGAPLIARVISEIAHGSTGIDIHPGARIGGSFFIDHGTGVVIGETSVIGERVRLYQGVTLGAKSFPLDEHGAPIKGAPRHPIVEDDVVIYAGATVLGRVTVGRGSSIGGNVWLTRSVPPHSRITQAQARNEMFDEGAGI